MQALPTVIWRISPSDSVQTRKTGADAAHMIASQVKIAHLEGRTVALPENV